MEPAIVAANTASNRHDWRVIPEGTGTSSIPAATANTISQRISWLRTSFVSDVSGVGGDGSSTCSSFYSGDTRASGYYAIEGCGGKLLKFEGFRADTRR